MTKTSNAKVMTLAIRTALQYQAIIRKKITLFVLQGFQFVVLSRNGEMEVQRKRCLELLLNSWLLKAFSNSCGFSAVITAN